MWPWTRKCWSIPWHRGKIKNNELGFFFIKLHLIIFKECSSTSPFLSFVLHSCLSCFSFWCENFFLCNSDDSGWETLYCGEGDNIKWSIFRRTVLWHQAHSHCCAALPIFSLLSVSINLSLDNSHKWNLSTGPSVTAVLHFTHCSPGPSVPQHACRPASSPSHARVTLCLLLHLLTCTGLLPLFGSCEWCCCGHGHADVSLRFCFPLVWVYTQRWNC